MRKADHQRWLEKRGLTFAQIKKKRKGGVVEIPSYKVENNLPLSDMIGNGFKRNSVLDNLSKENIATRNGIIEKAARTAPAFNKGGYQYITPGEDLTKIGSRSRRN